MNTSSRVVGHRAPDVLPRAALLLVLFAGSTPVQAQGECLASTITCSEAKRQNLEYCASSRRAESGMSEEGCVRSGEAAMRDCLKTGRWLTGRRNLCGLTQR